MSTTQSDLQYVKQAMAEADAPSGQPVIYLLWGIIVLAGYSIAEININWVNSYWLVAAPLGLAASSWLGHRHSKHSGQINSRLGKLYLGHFGIMTAVIFVAAFSGQYQSILLIIALGYCLAGIHLERPMLWVGLLTLAAYIGVVYGVINSNLILGIVISAGLFVTAWNQRKANNHE